MRLTLLSVGLLAMTLTPEPARSALGTGPSFSDPLTIDNPYFPLPALGKQMVKTLSAGDGEWEMAWVSERTRTFFVDGQAVEARELWEIEFLWDWLIEYSVNYFAQADDGSVYYFGEVTTILDSKAGEGESWLVGGPTKPSDPAGTHVADEPALFMPANPEIGMTWNPEDLDPLLTETAVVIGIDGVYSSGPVTLTDCLVLHLSSEGEDDHIKMYAPGYGEIYTEYLDSDEIIAVVGYRTDE